jgi:predicted nucleic acid-binding Zn ribbon protein
MTKTKPCLNCGEPFEPPTGHHGYCSDLCVKLAANRRRRARRHVRKPAPQATACYCVACEVEFPATPENLAEHSEDNDCYWYALDPAPRTCAGCGKPSRQSDQFCSDDCFVKVGNRLIPHDPANPLTADSIIWSPYFEQIIFPAIG